MKGLLRSAWVQEALAGLIVAYARLATATMRWRDEGREAGDAALMAAAGGIVLFWHGRIAFAMAARRVMAPKVTAVMISLSRDGQFITRAAERLGVRTIRGSAGRADSALGKGGAAAFRKAHAFIGEGGALLITPDGPRGPNQVLPLGPLQLARAAGCQVWLAGLAGRPRLAFKSWDNANLPLPFSRGTLVLEGPLFTPADADEAALEAVRARWQERLRAVQARAEALADAPS